MLMAYLEVLWSVGQGCARNASIQHEEVDVRLFIVQLERAGQSQFVWVSHCFRGGFAQTWTKQESFK